MWRLTAAVERMGLRPKALLASGDYTFLDRILYALSGFDTVVLSVARQGQLSNCGLPCREDIHPDCGPMGGLHTALTYATTWRSPLLQ